MKNLQITSLLLAILAAFLLSSCKQEEPETEEADEATTKEVVETQSSYDDVYRMANESLETMEDGGQTSFQLSVGSCANVTVDTTNQTISIDFGSNCVGVDGVTRSGKIIINYIGQYRQPGSEFSITFDNYMADDYALGGTLAVTNFSRNASNQLYFSVSVTNATVDANGSSLVYNTQRTFTWIEGEASGNLWDDVIQIEGNSSGVNSEGSTYTATISSPVLLETTCWQQEIFLPTEGSIRFIVPRYPNFTLDFGNGTCDKAGTIQVGVRTYDFAL